MSRMWFAIKKTWQFRKKLKHIRNGAPNNYDDVTKIDGTELVNAGKKGVILDFDGVLAPHGRNIIDKDVEAWLLGNIRKKNNLKFFVLSNKPMRVRENYFADVFPEVEFVSGVKKKPYPDGILKIIKDFNLAPDELVIVDDRLATGGLAGILAKIDIIYIYPPRTDVGSNIMPEIFFKFLRLAERAIIKLC